MLDALGFKGFGFTAEAFRLAGFGFEISGFSGCDIPLHLPQKAPFHQAEKTNNRERKAGPCWPPKGLNVIEIHSK